MALFISRNTAVLVMTGMGIILMVNTLMDSLVDDSDIRKFSQLQENPVQYVQERDAGPRADDSSRADATEADDSSRADAVQEDDIEEEAIPGVGEDTQKHAQETLDVQRSDEASPAAKWNTSLIIYNKVSKCGSSSVTATFTYFMKHQRYITNKEFPSLNPTLANKKQKLAEILNRLREQSEVPLLFVKHFYFVDFEQYGFRAPVYIQVIREPVHRAISLYQYMMDEGRINPTEWNMSVGRCLADLRSCPVLVRVMKSSMLGWFDDKAPPFGALMNSHSASNYSRAVSRAKQNIDKYFSVVGMTEDLAAFYEVLEYVHPNYFHGIAHYQDCLSRASLDHQRVSRHHKDWPEKAKSMVARILWGDIEIYKFVQRRFRQQLEEARRHRERNTSEEEEEEGGGDGEEGDDCDEVLRPDHQSHTQEWEHFGETVEAYIKGTALDTQLGL